MKSNIFIADHFIRHRHTISCANTLKDMEEAIDMRINDIKNSTYCRYCDCPQSELKEEEDNNPFKIF